jgi:hypothetical protein
LALKGSTDDKSKVALAHLLASSDERVSKATFLAIEKSYEPVLDSQADASGKKFNFAKVFLEAQNQVKGTDHPDLTFSSSPDWSSEWKQPTPGDKAIFAALKSRVKVNDANTDTDKDAQALLLVLSKFYKQTENP